MKPAVVTPYYQEDAETLRRSYLSVDQQSVGATHFYVGDGMRNSLIDEFDAIHLSLPVNSADNGNTPRCLGALMAASLGHDPIFFLDADNYFLGDHIHEALALKKLDPSLDVIFSGRIILLDDGSKFAPAPEDRMRLFADTSTMCFFRSSYRALGLWGLIPKALSPICDRIIYESISSMGLSVGWTGRDTMVFESHYKAHYQATRKKPMTPLHDPDWNSLKRILDLELNKYRECSGIDISIQL